MDKHVNLHRLGEVCEKGLREATVAYQEKVLDLVKKEEKFVDDQFPPCDASLFGRGALFEKKSSTIKWKRATPIDFDPERTIFGEKKDAKASPNDIEQGILGDCYFLSALSTLALIPDAIEDLVVQSPALNTLGIYQFRFFMNGVWQVVSIDDYLPVDEDSNFCYSRCRNPNAIWVPLLEKAYAKFHGSYHAIAAGEVSQTLAEMTSAPCSDYDLKNHEEFDLIWSVLLSSKEAGHVMCAGAGGIDDAELYKDVGLQMNHAYGVLDARDVERIDEKTGEVTRHRLLLIRNPWGKFEYVSRWTKESDSWTSALREELCRYTDSENNGVFWMEYDPDFLLFFRHISICKIQSDHFQVSFVDRFQKCDEKNVYEISTPLAPYQFTVYEPTWVTISVIQPSQRGYTPPPHHYMDAGFIVMKSKISEMTRVNNVDYNSFVFDTIYSGKSVRDMNEEVLFQPGFVYSVTPYSMKATNKYPFVLSLYSSNIVSPTINKPLLSIPHLTQSLYKAIRKNADNEVSYPMENVCVYCPKIGNSMFILLENKSNYFVACLLDGENSSGVQSSRESLKLRDVIPPHSQQLLVVMTAIDQYKGFAFSYRYAFKQASMLIVEHVPNVSDTSIHQVLSCID